MLHHRIDNRITITTSISINNVTTTGTMYGIINNRSSSSIN
jgi:hypothetical protein